MATGNRFRLRRLKLKNYRSIKTCNLSLGPLTLLVGPNGSGKSNVLDALRFASQALSENLDNALRERGGIAEVRRRSTGHPTHFSISVDFDIDNGRQTGQYTFEIGAARGGEYRVSREKCIIHDAQFGVPERSFETSNSEVVHTSEDHLPRVFPDRLLLVALSGQEAFRPLFDGLASLGVYSPAPEVMRLVQKPDPGDLLRRDASNIASVIERLRRTDPATKSRIEDYLSQIVPGIRAVERVGVANWETLQFQQDVQGAQSPWSFQASSMSDGTLRALGVLVALFSGSGTVMSPVGIEEPESALHPAASGLLLDAIRDASERRQILVTSHSPDLLDSSSITIDELFAVRSDSGTTVVARPDAAAQTALRESLFTAGELVRTDQLQPELGDSSW